MMTFWEPAWVLGPEGARAVLELQQAVVQSEEQSEEHLEAHSEAQLV